jgi:hypothetical protein
VRVAVCREQSVEITVSFKFARIVSGGVNIAAPELPQLKEINRSHSMTVDSIMSSRILVVGVKSVYDLVSCVKSSISTGSRRSISGS